jgi:adhesin/invasin
MRPSTRSGRRARRAWLALSLAGVALIAACLDSTGPPSILGELRVRAVYPDGMDPASLRVDVDSIWAVIRRTGPDEVIVDRVRASPGDGELRWILDLAGSPETFQVSLELRSGSQPMYGGTGSAAVQEGPVGSAAVQDIAVAYIGPTPRAVSLEVQPPGIAMSAIGERRTLRAVALDEAGDTVFRPVAWSVLDPAVATVDGGEVTATGTGRTHVVAAIDGLADSALVLVDTALVARTTLTAAPDTLVADGSATSVVTVEVRDGDGNVVGASAGPVRLSATLGTILPDTATDHGDGTYTATLTAGRITGTSVITGTLGGVTIGDTARVALVPGPADPTTTTLTAAPDTLVAGSGDRSVVTVTLRDAAGNPLDAGGATVRLSTTLGTIPEDPAIDRDDGTYTAALAAGTVAGTAVITGTLDGVAIGDTARVELLPGPADPVTTTMTPRPDTLVADGIATSVVTVEVRDSSGNLVRASAGTVRLSTTLGTILQDPAADHGDGTYTATLRAGTTTGTALITGTLGGAAIGDTARVELVPGPPDRTTTTLTAAPDTVTAGSGGTSVVSVVVRDANGNRLRQSAGRVALGAILGTVGPVTDHQDGTYTARFTPGSVTGTAVVAGTLDLLPIGDTAGIVIVPGPSDPTTTTIDAVPDTLEADGGATSVVRVEVRDSSGNLVGQSAGTVQLSTTLGTILPDPATDHGDGTYTATLTAGTAAGTAIITGTLGGVAIADTARVELTPGPPDPTTTTLAAAPDTLVAGGGVTAVVTVVVRDAAGNLLGRSAGTVALGSTQGSLGFVTDHGNGTYTASLNPGSRAGTAVVTGTLNGAAIQDSAVVAIVPGPVDPPTTTLSVAPDSLPADGVATSVVTVVVRDAAGNPVGTSAGTVRLYTTLGGIHPDPAIDHGDGTYTATLTAGTTAGTAVVTGTLNGAVIGDTAQVALLPGPGDPTTSSIDAVPDTLEAGGMEESLVTVEVRDSLGNLVGKSAGTVTLATTLGALGAVTDHGDGTYTAALFPGTMAGTAVVTGTLNGVAIQDSAVVAIVPGPAATVTITADSTTMVADGSSTTLVLVRVLDAYGNLVGGSAGTVVLAASLGTLDPVTDRGDGTYKSELVAGTEPGDAIITGTLDGAPIADSAVVVLTPPGSG